MNRTWCFYTRTKLRAGARAGLENSWTAAKRESRGNAAELANTGQRDSGLTRFRQAVVVF